jgi:hypothetical protein
MEGAKPLTHNNMNESFREHLAGIFQSSGADVLVLLSSDGLDAFIDEQVSPQALMTALSILMTHSSKNRRFRAIYKLSQNALEEILKNEIEVLELEPAIQALIAKFMGGSYEQEA